MKEFKINGKVLLNFIKTNYRNAIHNLIGPVGSGKSFGKIMKVLYTSHITGNLTSYYICNYENINLIENELIKFGFTKNDDLFIFNEEFKLNEELIAPNLEIKIITLDDYLNTQVLKTHNVLLFNNIELLNYDTIQLLINKNVTPFPEDTFLFISDSFGLLNYNSVNYEYQPDGDSVYAENTENLPENYYATLKKHLPIKEYRRLVQVNFTRY